MHRTVTAEAAVPSGRPLQGLTGRWEALLVRGRHLDQHEEVASWRDSSF